MANYHSADIAFLKARIQEIRGWPDSTVAEVYAGWSDLVYCAGWMMPDTGGATKNWEKFRAYVIPDIDRAKGPST